MWQCPNCGEPIDDEFDACWKCGTAQDGTPAAEFRAEPDDPTVPDLGPDSETRAISAADAEAERMRNERIVELCSVGNMAEADGLCELLQEAGIRTRIVGDFLGNAAGCLPLGETTAPRVWVRQRDAAHARRVIRKWRNQEENELAECPNCGESIDDEFDACWKCGTARDGTSVRRARRFRA